MPTSGTMLRATACAMTKRGLNGPFIARLSILCRYGALVLDVLPDDRLEILIGPHAQRRTQHRREVRGPRCHDAVDRRIDLPFHARRDSLPCNAFQCFDHLSDTD